MASKAEEKALVETWAKAQKQLEAANAAAEQARVAASAHAKSIYQLFGTEPFHVKALDRSYRAVHKPARESTNGKTIAEVYMVIPLPDNQPTRDF